MTLKKFESYVNQVNDLIDPSGSSSFISSQRHIQTLADCYNMGLSVEDAAHGAATMMLHLQFVDDVESLYSEEIH